MEIPEKRCLSICVFSGDKNSEERGLQVTMPRAQIPGLWLTSSATLSKLDNCWVYFPIWKMGICSTVSYWAPITCHVLDMGNPRVGDKGGQNSTICILLGRKNKEQSKIFTMLYNEKHNVSKKQRQNIKRGYGYVCVHSKNLYLPAFSDWMKIHASKALHTR